MQAQAYQAYKVGVALYGATLFIFPFRVEGGDQNMIITQKIKIHLDKRFLETPTVEAVQGETTRAVEFLLYNGGAEWTVPEGTTVTVRYRIYDEGAYYSSTYDTLPDGSLACCIDGSTLTVYLPTEALSIWGVGELQLGLFNGDTAIALFTVLVRVQQDLSFDGASPDVHQDVSAQIYSAVNQWADRNYGGGVTADDLNALRAETESYIADEFAKHGQLKPEFANSVDACTDTSKLYVLPDGYIYAYMQIAGGAAFTNLADESSTDWLDGKRYNSSYVETTAETDVTNYIAAEGVSVFHLKGLDILSNSFTGDNYGRIYCYDADKNYIGYVQPNVKSIYQSTAEYDDTVCVVDWLSWITSYPNSAGKAAYVRFGGLPAGDVIITADEDIVYNADGRTWGNTGHAFVPADYEERIADLEEQAAETAVTLKNLETGKDTVVPEYWNDAVNEAVAKAKALQGEGGKDVVNFLWFSDMHYEPGNRYVSNIGGLCASIMDACDIPLVLMCGDTMSAAVVDTEQTLLSYLEGAADVLSPIGRDGLLQIRGNHDDVYGCYADGDTTKYYVNKAAPAKIWNSLHRAQAQDLRRVFGGDGSYFYLDNAPQKVRFICLNSHYYDGDAITNGTEKMMTSGFGSEQLSWLEHTAMAVGEGWSVVIATHVPPTAQAVNGNKGYLAQLSDGEDFRSIIANSVVDIMGIFCGHCHADAVVTDDLSCPIVTITCATNTPYDGTAADRVLGTSSETAIDIVSINKAARTIHTTRLGTGEDRAVHY